MQRSSRISGNWGMQHQAHTPSQAQAAPAALLHPAQVKALTGSQGQLLNDEPILRRNYLRNVVGRGIVGDKRMIIVGSTRSLRRSIAEGLFQPTVFVVYTRMARPKRFELLTPRFPVWCKALKTIGYSANQAYSAALQINDLQRFCKPSARWLRAVERRIGSNC